MMHKSINTLETTKMDTLKMDEPHGMELKRAVKKCMTRAHVQKLLSAWLSG